MYTLNQNKMRSRSAIIIVAILAFLMLSSTSRSAQWKHIPSTNSFPDHPRLLLLKGEEDAIKKIIGEDSTWAKLNSIIIEEAGKMLTLPELQRIQTGLRLLAVSREALRRIFFLSYAHRITGSPDYAAKAEKEMLAISVFEDWNPSHFLDVAEMTMGMSIGYDWLHDFLSPRSREIIGRAIFQKGIDPSMNRQNAWYKGSSNNWNQVCNAGIAFGAIALYDHIPETALNIINEAVETITLPMKEYGPDGAYPEGFGYWDYGTSFNVLFLNAIEKIYGTDFITAPNDPFMKTAVYRMQMTGPSNLAFNYSDNLEAGQLNPAMFWFAAKSGDASILWNESKYLLGNISPNDRILPAIMLWGSKINAHPAEPPKDLCWMGRGIAPVFLMRTSWTNPSAIFVGVKGGTASSPHAHMDAGSFVIDADGVRWASDFGMQDYNSLESKGVDLWNRSQNSDRWRVFRYNNLAHNTITVNGEFHVVKGMADIISSSSYSPFMNVIVEMKDIFGGKLLEAKRGVAIVDGKYISVRDEIKASGDPVNLRWTMLTTAEVKITGRNSFELLKNGRKMKLEVIEPSQVNLKTWSTVSPNDFDADNEGSILIGFETNLAAGAKTALLVKLIPQSAGESSGTIPPLSEWPK